MSIRRETNKEKIINELRKMPIVTVVCQRARVSTASYYRWRDDDPEFADDCDEAIREGSMIVNDMVESQLLKGINDGVAVLIMYYLNNRHPNYRNNKVWQVQANADRDKEQYRQDLQKIRDKIGAFLDEAEDDVLAVDENTDEDLLTK